MLLIVHFFLSLCHPSLDHRSVRPSRPPSPTRSPACVQLFDSIKSAIPKSITVRLPSFVYIAQFVWLARPSLNMATGMIIKMIKKFVSKKKKRYEDDEFNLDLSCKFCIQFFVY